MTKILVVCGNGIASSSIMVATINDYLKEEGLENQAQVDKKSLMDCTADTYNSYNLVVSSTKIDKPGIETPVIIGAGLLSGIGEEEILEQVKEVIVS